MYARGLKAAKCLLDADQACDAYWDVLDVHAYIRESAQRAGIAQITRIETGMPAWTMDKFVVTVYGYPACAYCGQAVPFAFCVGCGAPNPYWERQ